MDELRYAASQFATVPDYPTAVGAVISQVELANDLGPFQDRLRLAKVVQHLSDGTRNSPHDSSSLPSPNVPSGAGAAYDPWAPPDVSGELLRTFNQALTADSDELRLMGSPAEVRAAVYWFGIAPTMLFFEGLVDQRGRRFPVPLLPNAIALDGAGCAAITQGYCAFLLFRVLSNAPDFRDAMRMNPTDVAGVLTRLPNPLPLRAFEHYRDHFAVPVGEPGSVDPRDWALVWLWDLANVLIPDESQQAAAFKDWDHALARLEFSAREMERFGKLRQTAEDYVAGRVQ